MVDKSPHWQFFGTCKSNSTKERKKNPTCTDCCQLGHALINIQDIGWHSWIIAPLRISLGYCFGKCTKSNYRHHTTDHASLTQPFGLNNSSFQSCCVPTKYKVITIVFVNENSVIQIKTLPLISASRCDCYWDCSLFANINLLIINVKIFVMIYTYIQTYIQRIYTKNIYLTFPKFRVTLIFAQKRCAKIKLTIFAHNGCEN